MFTVQFECSLYVILACTPCMRVAHIKTTDYPYQLSLSNCHVQFCIKCVSHIQCCAHSLPESKKMVNKRLAYGMFSTRYELENKNNEIKQFSDLQNTLKKQRRVCNSFLLLLLIVSSLFLVAYYVVARFFLILAIFLLNANSFVVISLCNLNIYCIWNWNELFFFCFATLDCLSFSSVLLMQRLKFYLDYFLDLFFVLFFYYCKTLRFMSFFYKYVINRSFFIFRTCRLSYCVIA